MPEDPKASPRKVRWDPNSEEFARFLAKPKIASATPAREQEPDANAGSMGGPINPNAGNCHQETGNLADGTGAVADKAFQGGPVSAQEASPYVQEIEVRGWRSGISKVQLQRSIDIISPPPRVSPSEWAELYAYLPEEENAEPGKFHLSRRAHEAEMLDAVLDPRVRENFWMGASQVMGKTLCFILLIMYYIHQVRKSVVMVRPDIDASANWCNDKLLPTIEATPCMAGLMVDPRKQGGRSKGTNRRFPGGSLRLIGANSPSGFRSGSAPFVAQDEIDAFETNKEGDPCKLGDRAAKTFSNKWLIKASTTTLEGMSRIAAGVERGDKRQYFLPCLHCGTFQHLLTERMKFSFTPEEHARFTSDKSFDQVVNENTWQLGDLPIRDTPRTIYVCEKCERGWTDTQRLDAYFSGHPDNPPVVVAGKELRAHWRPTAVDDKGNPKPFNGVRSYLMNGMYMAVGLEKEYSNYLHMFAEWFLEAKKDGRASLQTWTNIFKNEPFADVSEKMEWEPLRDRAEEYLPDLPPQAIGILFAVDIQKDRVEILWIAFGVDEEAWVLEYEVFPGDFDSPSKREEFAAYIFSKKFNHPYLGELRARAGCIDTGHQTKVKAVYKFCKKYRSGKVFAIKGRAKEGMASTWERSRTKRAEGVDLYLLNVDELKSRIADRLSTLEEPGPNFIHFPAEVITYTDKDGKKQTIKTKFNATFYKGLCSERRMPEKKPDGRITYRWKKFPDSARNEPLDMMTYIYGLYDMQKLGPWINQTWKKVEDLMRERESLDSKHQNETKLKGGENIENVPTPIRETLPASELISRISERKPMRPAAQRQRMPHRPMRKRPTMNGWSRGLYNPLNV